MRMNFDKLTKYLDALPREGVPGCDLVVCKDHEQLYRHQAGFRDAALTQPVRDDDTYNLYSATKVFTTCAAMQLIERGILSLDDAVADYLPAYAHMNVKDGNTVRPAKRVMTVRHLMSMQSGLDYDMETEAIHSAIEALGPAATTRQLVDAKAQDPLMFEPGTNFLYSLSHDVLAAVIEVASGMKFSEYLKKNIFDPLGLTTIGFQLKETDHARQCAQYMYNGEKKTFDPIGNEELPYRYTPNYESGGAGLISDLRDYSTFADAIACDGKSKDGYSVLTPAMIQLWSANQLGPVSRKTFDVWARRGYSYGLGVRTRVTLQEGGRGSIGEFGWDGAADSWVMIDPHLHLSAFFAMHVRGFPYAYDVIHPNLRNLIYEALE